MFLLLAPLLAATVNLMQSHPSPHELELVIVVVIPIVGNQISKFDPEILGDQYIKHNKIEEQ